MNYIEVIEKWKINHSEIARRLSMPIGTFNNKINTKQNIYQFTEAEVGKIGTILLEMAGDITSIRDTIIEEIVTKFNMQPLIVSPRPDDEDAYNIVADVKIEPNIVITLPSERPKYEDIKNNDSVTEFDLDLKENKLLGPIRKKFIPYTGCSDQPAESISCDNLPIRETSQVISGKAKKVNDLILAQIKAIEAEKVPKERDTPNGRRSWRLDQKKRIDERKKQLK